MHLVSPHPRSLRTKKKKCITIVLLIVFDFSWDDCNTQEKLQAMIMQIWVGGRGWVLDIDIANTKSILADSRCGTTVQRQW